MLWTGGWDSAFRLLDLVVRQRRRVQPYYILDDIKLRPSVPAERQAMERIRARLAERYPDAASFIAPTIECALHDISFGTMRLQKP